LEFAGYELDDGDGSTDRSGISDMNWAPAGALVREHDGAGKRQYA
jgi:hypothetical protein